MSSTYMNKYSVLFPLYIKDDPCWFEIALKSILDQSVFPDEIVIVGDGEISNENRELLELYSNKYPGLFNIKIFDENRGLGRTLADGIELCRNEYIARMDADDYTVPTRCEKQLRAFHDDPELALVGSYVDEFVGDITNVKAHVILPETHEEIVKFAKRRCPIRHPAIMYKKSEVLRSGNYRDYRHAQDYNLIVHMLLNGCKMYNIPRVLVYMRVNPDFYARRGGIQQMKIILRMKKEFMDCGFYSVMDFAISGIGNALVCLLPNKLRMLFYKKILRR